MVADAERYRLDDLEQRKRATARNELEIYCRVVTSGLIKRGINNCNTKALLEKCEQTIQWLEKGPLASTEETFAKKEDIERLWIVILFEPSAPLLKPQEEEQIPSVANGRKIAEEVD